MSHIGKRNKRSAPPWHVENVVQIDHFLADRAWKHSVLSCRACPSADISSDHFLVVVELRIKFARAPPKKDKKPLYGSVSEPEASSYNEEARSLLKRIRDGEEGRKVSLGANQPEHPNRLEPQRQDGPAQSTETRSTPYLSLCSAITEAAANSLSPISAAARQREYLAQDTLQKIEHRKSLRESGDFVAADRVTREIRKMTRRDKKAQKLRTVSKDLDERDRWSS